MFVSVAALGYCISFGVACLMHSLAQVFIVFFMAICPLHSLAHSFHQFHLSLALRLYGFMGSFHGFKKVCFGNFLHLAFHHHDVVISSADHNVHIGLLKLLESRVNDKFTVYPCNPYFRDRASERNIAHGQSSRCCKSGQSIGHIYPVCGEQYDIYIDFSVEVIREQRSQRPVHKTASQDFIIGSTSFTACKSTGKTSER